MRAFPYIPDQRDIVYHQQHFSLVVAAWATHSGTNWADLVPISQWAFERAVFNGVDLRLPPEVYAEERKGTAYGLAFYDELVP